MTKAPESVEWLHHHGHIADIDRHFAAMTARLAGDAGEAVAVAAALVSAAVQGGHTCIALRDVAGSRWPDEDGIELPGLEAWIGELADSPAVARPGAGERRPLVLDDAGRLYLERLQVREKEAARRLRRLAGAAGPEPSGLDAALDRLFTGAEPDARPRAAARATACHRLCGVSGGPGTGKTTIVARIMVLLIELGITSASRVVLAAPTGKAAARLQEAVHRELQELGRPEWPVPGPVPVEAVTVHRWLRAGRNLKSVDVLVIDEASMVDISLATRLLEVLPDHARLVLLGDATQLASVQPGSVFADLCDAAGRPSSPLAPCVVELVHNWRFDRKGGVGRLAAAVAAGDAQGAVAALDDPGDPDVAFCPLTERGDFEAMASRFTDEHYAPLVRDMRSRHGPAGAEDPFRGFRVLCAHRTGPWGTGRFNALVESRLRALGLAAEHQLFYAGRPIIITRNDPRTGLSNGDTGIVLHDESGQPRVWFPVLRDGDGNPRLVSPARLPDHESFFALTVHRSQGSEYDEVAVVPGPAESHIATRELLYTAVTRSKRKVVVHGDRKAVEAAVKRETRRTSGLCDALVLPGKP